MTIERFKSPALFWEWLWREGLLKIIFWTVIHLIIWGLFTLAFASIHDATSIVREAFQVTLVSYVFSLPLFLLLDLFDYCLPNTLKAEAFCFWFLFIGFVVGAVFWLVACIGGLFVLEPIVPNAATIISGASIGIGFIAGFIAYVREN